MNGKDEIELAGLLRSATEGDERAYAAFLARIAPVLRGFARRKIVGGVDVEDIVQETLLAIHLKRHTWMVDAPVMPWVYAIARHKLIDAFRKRGRRIEVDIGDFVDTLPQPEQPETVNSRDINRVLDALPSGQRSVVSAISVDGASIPETARKLDMTETAVRVSLHRGLSAIAKKFGRG